MTSTSFIHCIVTSRSHGSSKLVLIIEAPTIIGLLIPSPHTMPNTMPPQPPGTPETIYKFMRLYNVEEPPSRSERYTILALKKGQFYFAHADEFNDPFDVNWHLDYDATFDKKVEWGVDFLSRTRPEMPADMRKEEAKRHLLERQEDDEHSEWVKNEYLRSTKDKFGILSLSGVHDNVLMWSHYANNHKGICVGIDSGKLADLQRRHASRHGTVLDLRRVSYQEEIPRLNFFEQFKGQDKAKSTLEHLLTVKFKAWEYEKEYRLIHYNGASVPYTFGIELISEIYLGCRIQKSQRDEVIRIIEQQNRPDVKVFQAQKHPTRFELVFDQVL